MFFLLMLHRKILLGRIKVNAILSFDLMSFLFLGFCRHFCSPWKYYCMKLYFSLGYKISRTVCQIVVSTSMD